jgi:uncharacterized protein (TIGR02147 family)
MNIYHATDYRDLITQFLEVKIGRGSRAKLADVLNCHPGYLSQVLGKGKVHFTPENILKIAQFLGLDETQSDFLMDLLQKERAGTPEAREFFERRLARARQENLKIEAQITESNTRELDDAAKATYYSHWSYSAVHMAVSVPALNQIETLESKLQLPAPFLKKILAFLEETGLVTRTGERYAIGMTRIHLSKDSPLIRAHHQNYRHKAIRSLENENDFDLHYSAVLTLSREDARRVRDLLLGFVKEKEEILIPSPNEEIVFLNLDLFKP